MIKQSVIFLIALCAFSVAYAGFLPCPGNASKPPVVYNGKKLGDWRVSITEGNSFALKTSTPGFVKVKNSDAPGLVCYADNTWNPMNPDQNKKPIYNVVLSYTGKCVSPKKVAGGFNCN